MIRLVKAVSDFPQVSYVLAFDPSYIESSLEGAGISSARAYLDKIVQVRVSLPRISLAQIGRIVDNEISTVLSEQSLDLFPKERERLSYLYHRAIKFLLRTPRDVYRVFNRMRFLHPATKHEIGFADLLALETIAITAPALYDHIRKHPQAYVGALEEDFSLMRAKDVVQNSEAERHAILSSCPHENRDSLGELLGEIFPLIDRGRSFDNRAPSRTSGRIACADNLVIALTGDLPSSEVSLSRVRLFLEDPAVRSDIARDVAASKKLEDFLELANDAIKSRLPSDPEDLVETLSEIAEFKEVSDIDMQRHTSFLKPPTRVRIFWILKQILEGLDRARAFAIVDQLCRSHKKIAISTELLEFLCAQQGLLDGEPRELEKSWLVTAEQLQLLVDAWVAATRDAFLEGDAFSSNEAGPAFLLLMQLNNGAVREVVSRSLDSGERMDAFARVIGLGSWDSVKGAYAKVGGDFLAQIGDPDLVRSRARSRLGASESLPSDLRAIYTSIVSGDKQYFVDFE